MSELVYKCLSCGKRFDFPRKLKTQSGVVCDDGWREVTTTLECPHCGSEYFTSYQHCPNCDGGLLAEGDIICDDCKQSMITWLRLVLRIGLNENELKQLDNMLDGHSIFEIL